MGTVVGDIGVVGEVAVGCFFSCLPVCEVRDDETDKGFEGIPRAEAKACERREGPDWRGSEPGLRGFLLLLEVKSPGLPSPRDACEGAGAGVGTGMDRGTLSADDKGEGVEDGGGEGDEADEAGAETGTWTSEGWHGTLVGGLDEAEEGVVVEGAKV